MHFYGQAADILRRLEQHQGSIQTLTVGNRAVASDDKRRMYALICETLKYASVLAPVVQGSGVLGGGIQGMNTRLALAMAHDMLVSRGGLQRRGADHELNRAFEKYKPQLRAKMDALVAEAGARSMADLVPLGLREETATLRHVRVNLLAASVDQVVAAFEKEQFELVECRDHSLMAQELPARSRRFMRDPDLDDLLVFPSGTDLHAHPLYTDGTIILQDKASCMPAHVVRPKPGTSALDACAAPGNKTSHMASLMGNKGSVFAFDKSARRLDTLVQLTDRARCRIIRPLCADFLDVDPLNPLYADVECALLDPSCSGSGIVNRLDALVDGFVALVQGQEQHRSNATRLESLAEFQIAVVLHAMRFPSVRRISYSTCSVHVEENEAVVAAILNAQDEFALMPAVDVIPTWPRRGLAHGGLTSEQAACVVRTLPEDGTNGFFVAGFVRKKPADIGEIRRQLDERRTQQQQQTQQQTQQEVVDKAPERTKAQPRQQKKPKKADRSSSAVSFLPGRRARSAVTARANVSSNNSSNMSKKRRRVKSGKGVAKK
ncbi:hypothetical protein J3B02_000857 [Coemansia erecta]|nr:hypothetical protein J3B02_000857 [Coemansia erecta]KAJ2878952.1 hypothetical protein FB639_003223 [Coemansia asiatica]